MELCGAVVLNVGVQWKHINRINETLQDFEYNLISAVALAHEALELDVFGRCMRQPCIESIPSVFFRDRLQSDSSLEALCTSR